ncbi:MAG: DMT family transporter [Rickettsiales bacterium]|nr:DMT family transporter [Rickettsiales bacterium]
MILLAFISMSLAWSFSWFAMKLQVDSLVPPELSVFYRFAFTSLLMFALCFFAKQRTWLRRKEINFFLFIGLTNFFLNFVIGYFAVHYIPSGVIATIFSLSIITSEIISSFVDRRKIEKKVIVSSVLGVIGLMIFILPTIHFGEKADAIKTLTGIGMSLVMMLVFSAGSVAVGKNRQVNGTPLYTSIAFGSAFGSLYLLLFNLLRGNEFIFDSSAKYLWSFAYLVVVASVVAFICLFYLIQHVGSTRANYTALVYPVIALITSALLENFEFKILSVVGLVMILLAIAIEFAPSGKKYLRR